MSRKLDTLTIAPSAEELLAHQRHVDWAIAHAQGRTRFGRPYIRGGVQGAHKTRKARSKRACRGKVRL